MIVCLTLCVKATSLLDKTFSCSNPNETDSCVSSLGIQNLYSPGSKMIMPSEHFYASFHVGHERRSRPVLKYRITNSGSLDHLVTFLLKVTVYNLPYALWMLLHQLLCCMIIFDQIRAQILRLITIWLSRAPNSVFSGL